MTNSEQVARWRKANPKRTREQQQRYLRKQRKPCPTCQTPIPYPSKGRVYCLACSPNPKLWEHRRYYRNMVLLAAEKLRLGCSRCGYRKSASALHFHHRDPSTKKREVRAINTRERAKCDILCANCHYEIHEEWRK